MEGWRDRRDGGMEGWRDGGIRRGEKDKEKEGWRDRKQRIG